MRRNAAGALRQRCEQSSLDPKLEIIGVVSLKGRFSTEDLIENGAKRIDVGAVIDRTQGNTAGLGGLFGFLWFVGKAPPAPEYQPYKRSWQFAVLAKLGPLLTKLQEQKK